MRQIFFSKRIDVTLYVEGKFRGWQVNSPEAIIVYCCLANWQTHSGWEIQIFGKRSLQLTFFPLSCPLSFKILVTKFTQISTVYLDSNLLFKNSLGLKLQEEKLNT